MVGRIKIWWGVGRVYWGEISNFSAGGGGLSPIPPVVKTLGLGPFFMGGVDPSRHQLRIFIW